MASAASKLERDLHGSFTTPAETNHPGEGAIPRVAEVHVQVTDRLLEGRQVRDLVDAVHGVILLGWLLGRIHREELLGGPGRICPALRGPSTHRGHGFLNGSLGHRGHQWA